MHGLSPLDLHSPQSSHGWHRWGPGAPCPPRSGFQVDFHWPGVDELPVFKAVSEAKGNGIC